MKAFARPSVGGGAKTLPAAWYISPDVFAEEEERIFRSEWLCVGREESLPRAGDFFTVDRTGESLIVTRDAGGTGVRPSAAKVRATSPDRFNARITRGRTRSTES